MVQQIFLWTSLGMILVGCVDSDRMMKQNRMSDLQRACSGTPGRIFKIIAEMPDGSLRCLYEDEMDCQENGVCILKNTRRVKR